MTRRERRGTIAVLLLIVLLLAGHMGVRSCRQEVDYELPASAVQQIEQAIDSTAAVVDKPAGKHRRDTTKHKRKHRSRKPSRPHSVPAPRRLDPVPRF